MVSAHLAAEMADSAVRMLTKRSDCRIRQCNDGGEGLIREGCPKGGVVHSIIDRIDRPRRSAEQDNLDQEERQPHHLQKIALRVEKQEWREIDQT